MKHVIVGTSGHIDHGKTALIKALTGFEGDTLEEEKKRGITINLSFSNLASESKNIAFIDVPGHEKLVKNMIAGAFGFDAALLVVDANEGIMPQTKEHLHILNLLHVGSLVVALTKCDLTDIETIQTREKEIKEYVEKLPYLNIKATIPVTIFDQNSINNLKKTLFSLEPKERKNDKLFRYYVDRSFSLAGAGAIVTGTILDGQLSVGDKIFAPEYEREFTVRNLQVHDLDTALATTSQRVAINLQGNSKELLEKGALLSKKGFLRGFECVDAWIETIEGQSLKHNSNVILYVGTKQCEAKILGLESEEDIKNGFVKLQFNKKLFLTYDEPFIISKSGRIAGGGRILIPIDDPIKKRVKLELLHYLKDRDFKNAFRLLVFMHKRGFGIISSNQRFRLNHD